AGPSGCGKSDLALRLIDRGARLLSDDQTFLQSLDGALVASPPPQIQGMMEIRHVGLALMPFAASAPVALYVDLVSPTEPLERLPEPESTILLGHPIPRLRLRAFETSAAAKIRAALTYTFKN
ncbi:MAG: HPr kinase/phosphatase C-terminal domain-containing protein, partial [Alphaproteobacteria bacterium]|nr:HPr kinase/phosphatase C-terminal domain-containing protein [Alphaproteobacteria bacterium]